ncbi:hypothetical protein BGX27_009787 [Mortierella sp. AM989]|nr:hypothetical protein BGX27_009787 [Mortierella sp. AM989]
MSHQDQNQHSPLPTEPPNTDVSDSVTCRSDHTTKRVRLHSPSPPSSPNLELPQSNRQEEQLENDPSYDFSSDSDTRSDNEPNDEDDLVLSEVHIHPDNGLVDGQLRTTTFYLGKDNQYLNNQTTETFPWDYAVEIQHAMGTTLRGVDYDTEILSNCKQNIALNCHLSPIKSQDTIALDKRIVPRRYNWLMDDPMGSLSDSSDEFGWTALEIEEWRRNGAFIFAADVVYDDSLTDALIACLEKLLVEPLPKDHRFHARGRVAYITLEKRFNFSLDQLSVVAQAHDYFVKEIAKSTLIEAHRVDYSQLGKHCDYERSKDLELFSVVPRDP